jgi:hypothetical protein
MKLTRAGQILEQKDRDYTICFNSKEGKAVLADLVALFLPEKLSTGDAHTTAIRVGESNPIRYIQRRIENGMDGQSNG